MFIWINKYDFFQWNSSKVTLASWGRFRGGRVVNGSEVPPNPPPHTQFFLVYLKRFCNHPSHGIMQSIVLENPRQVCLQKPYCFGHKCSQSAVKQILSVNVSFSFWWSGWGLALALSPQFLGPPLSGSAPGICSCTNKQKWKRPKKTFVPVQDQNWMQAWNWCGSCSTLNIFEAFLELLKFLILITVGI